MVESCTLRCCLVHLVLHLTHHVRHLTHLLLDSWPPFLELTSIDRQSLNRGLHLLHHCLYCLHASTHILVNVVDFGHQLRQGILNPRRCHPSSLRLKSGVILVRKIQIGSEYQLLARSQEGTRDLGFAMWTGVIPCCSSLFGFVQQPKAKSQITKMAAVRLLYLLLKTPTRDTHIPCVTASWHQYIWSSASKLCCSFSASQLHQLQLPTSAFLPSGSL
jgi:hypothetical protein